ncbi:MAG TPA: hypothetical protein VL945_00690 [Candidatus Saccharimonadales bacterium]|nr:hypothetical protein [Candidatus Saccharimonadales bacterium]
MLNVVSLYILYAIASLILAYRLYRLTRFRELAIYCAVLLLGIILFHYEQTSVALLLSGVIIFSAIISSYGTRLCYLFILVGLLYASLAYTIGAQFMLQSLFLGMFSGSNIAFIRKKTIRKDAELSRNAVQVVAGVFLIAVFYFLSSNMADAVLFWFVIIGSLLGNYALSRKSGAVSRFIYGLERDGTILGSGARWLAIGSLVAASFLTRNPIIVVFSAIFLADSFSTLVGMSFRTPRLPYNRNKSAGGTLAYFATVLAVSYFFIGPIAPLFAAFAAFLESQPFHIDDNFDVSLAMVALFALLWYLGAAAL